MTVNVIFLRLRFFTLLLRKVKKKRKRKLYLQSFLRLRLYLRLYLRYVYVGHKRNSNYGGLTVL